MKCYDLAIIGSGFGGSLSALVARRIGLSVLLLERGAHPRFAVGESTSPLANLVLEQLTEHYDLPRLRPLCSFGAWQRAYPELRCGLKRGFTFFAHTPHSSYQTTPERDNQLMVAASPHDEVADTHWLRADVDQFLVRETVQAGADYRERVALDSPQWDSDAQRMILTGTENGQPFSAQAKYIVDAGGPRSSFSHSLGSGEGNFPDYPPTQALYSHFVGVRRCDSLPEFSVSAMPPYPIDDAAVHHIFPGGWMWVLRFGSGITSAGIAFTDAYAETLGLADGPASAWERFLRRYPTISAQFTDARAIRPFVHTSRLAYRAQTASGPGWVRLPSATASIDPLFSTGIPLTLLGIERLGRIWEDTWATKEMPARLMEYSDQTLAEADAVADLVGACYASMNNFPVFADLTMLYFAAASYSEMARRLGTPELAGGFLGVNHPVFGPALRRITAQVRAGETRLPHAEFSAQVAEAVDCLNIAGLCDPRKRHWYGVDWDDVVRGAKKLGHAPAAMRAILRDAPWAQSEAPSRDKKPKAPSIEMPGY
jgi:FADH2 O2-dependent halogenase